MALKTNSSLIALVLTTLLAISTPVTGQLLGCSSVECPTSQNNESYSCGIGNSTAAFLGIANITTSPLISSEPLTWSLALSQITDSPSEPLEFVTKNFYLGTPSSLNLSNLQTITGCALFFEGITTNLQFPGAQYGISGTCTDVLSASCVSNLESQANTVIKELLTSANNTENICTSLGVALGSKPPQACTVGASLGTIVAREITGSALSPPVQLGDCHPTTGSNYSIFEVESFNSTSSEYDILPSVMGVTPIMTTFFPSPGLASTNASVTKQISAMAPEVHLSCMAIVLDDPPLENPAKGMSSALNPDLGAVSMLVILAFAAMLV